MQCVLYVHSFTLPVFPKPVPGGNTTQHVPLAPGTLWGLHGGMRGQERTCRLDGGYFPVPPSSRFHNLSTPSPN